MSAAAARDRSPAAGGGTLRHFHARPLRALGAWGVPGDGLEELGGLISRGLFEAGSGLRGRGWRLEADRERQAW